MYSFSYSEPVCCSMSSSNCCFLTCIQVSQEAGQVLWYSHLLQNFPQFIVIHKVEGFGVVNKAEIDVFAKSLGVLVSLQDSSFGSFEYIPRLGVARSYVLRWFYFNFLRNLHTVFHSSCIVFAFSVQKFQFLHIHANTYLLTF